MAATLKPSHSIPISFPSLHSPTKLFISTICMGGGPRTFPGGVTKWQWKRMQLKKAKQLLSARLMRERQIYEMRKRAELKAAVSELEKPWEVVEKAPVLFSVSADEQLKVLADRFLKPGGLDLWSEKDGPQLFDKGEDGRKGYRGREERHGRESWGKLKGKEINGAGLHDGSNDSSSCSGLAHVKDVDSNNENRMFSRKEGRIIGNGLSSEKRNFAGFGGNNGAEDDIGGSFIGTRSRNSSSSDGKDIDSGWSSPSEHKRYDEDDRSGSVGAFRSRNSSKGGSRNGSFKGRGGGVMGNHSFASSRSNFKTRDYVSSDDGRSSDLEWSNSAEHRRSGNDDSSRSSGVVGLRHFSKEKSRYGSSSGMGGAVKGIARRQNYQPRNPMNLDDREDANSGRSSSFQYRSSHEDEDSSRSFGVIGSRNPSNGRSRYVSLERRGRGMRNGSLRQNLKPGNPRKFDGEDAGLASRSWSERRSYSKDRSENLKFGRKEAWVARNGSQEDD
ncbi:putative DEAD-box ATP-dependent RNA helicase 33 [Drosera capensis]